MSQRLSYAGMKVEITISLAKILSLSDNANTGYVLEVGLKYTDEAQKYL